MPARIQKIDINTLGDNTIIPASTGAINIIHIWLIVANAVGVTFKDGTTAITGKMSLATNGGFAVNANREFPIILSAGNAFVINLDGNVQVSGMVMYDR